MSESVTSILAYRISQPAVLSATGEDAFSYLQSQFSGDLRKLDNELSAVYGLWLDRKGKVLADSSIIKTGDESFLIISEAASAEVLQQHLEAHIIADEVELEDVSIRYTLYALISSRSADQLSQVGGILLPPRQPATPTFRYLLVDKKEQTAVETHLKLITQEDYTAERVLARLPLVGVDLTESDLPQEAGMESYAVAFDKGCYLGQEVMARLHSMGKAQRSLISVRCGQAIESGQAISAGDRVIGDLRSVAHKDGSWLALAMVKNRFLDGKPLHIGDTDIPLHLLNE